MTVTDEVAVQYVLEGDKQLIEIQQKIKSAEDNEQFEELESSMQFSIPWMVMQHYLKLSN